VATVKDMPMAQGFVNRVAGVEGIAPVNRIKAVRQKTADFEPAQMVQFPRDCRTNIHARAGP
jgi:hypothetical protein